MDLTMPPEEPTPMPEPQPMPAPSFPSVKKDRSVLYTPIAIVVAGIIVAGGLYGGLAGKSSGAAETGNQAAAAATPSVNITDVKTAGEPFIGQANAPVTMAFWSDYQCPFCKAFEVGGVSGISTPPALPSLITQYVDTGKLKIVFKDFQFLGQNSIDDGDYARAIWALYPQQFFAWRTAIYTNEPEENSLSEAQNKTRLEQVTSSIAGIDLAAVEANVTKNKAAYDAAMQADMQEGENFGITGTPGFIIGTTLIAGDEPLSSFTTAIGAQLR